MGSKARLKTTPSSRSVAAFLAKQPAERRADCQWILRIMERATGAKATMWGPSIVGFGSYHYVYDSGREGDICRIGFSPRKANLVLYIYCDPKKLEQLGKHRKSVGCLYINKLADVDLKVLRSMIAQSWQRSIMKSPLC